MKTVIITGTSSGIGLELVKIFDSKGFNVISLSRNNLPNSINFSENVNHIKFDITKDSNIKSLVDTLKIEYKEIHILINNAGKLINKSFENFTDSEFRSVYDVNFFGVVNLIKSLMPFFNNNSHIVNISSVGGINGSSKFPGLRKIYNDTGEYLILSGSFLEVFGAKSELSFLEISSGFNTFSSSVLFLTVSSRKESR